MDKNNQITVNEYRKKHKRCKTCMYAEQNRIGWYCRAKGTLHCGDVGDACILGCFCKLYKAKEYNL